MYSFYTQFNGGSIRVFIVRLPNSKKKIKNNVRKWNEKYANGTLNIPNAMQSLNSWLGHSSHCNSYKLQEKILNKCDFLYSDSLYTNNINEQMLIDLIENQSKTDTSFH